jgi:chromosome segregation ATPase
VLLADDRLMDVEQQLWKAQTDLQATNARQQANEVAEQMMLAERDEDWMRLTKVNESLASRLKDKGHEIEQLERALKDVAAADPDAAMRLEEQQKQVKREQKLQLEKQDLQKKLHSQIESWAKVTARCEMLDRTKDQLQDRLKEAEAALSASMGGSSSAHVSALVSEVVQSEQLRKEKMEVAKLAEANKNKQKELAEKDKVVFFFGFVVFYVWGDYGFVRCLGSGKRV